MSEDEHEVRDGGSGNGDGKEGGGGGGRGAGEVKGPRAQEGTRRWNRRPPTGGARWTSVSRTQSSSPKVPVPTPELFAFAGHWRIARHSQPTPHTVAGKKSLPLPPAIPPEEDTLGDGLGETHWGDDGSAMTSSSTGGPRRLGCELIGTPRRHHHSSKIITYRYYEFERA